ncbi:hypothetical protein [Sphingomonas sp. PR090111-T3T-6A]|uniref:hypothetical protein n=1 Tax=Sphingomonas sp. PR090111-T3T-6A TaxID=685778 RepID=UPI000374170D|nr:hypothetical protein [Sphingomonas sp. PR090111-T3T-6A]
MLADGGTEKPGEQDRAGKVDRLAISLMELFGDRALEVSERQISMGNVVAVSEIWREISESIRKRHATR